MTLALCSVILDREHQLDALVEIARHPVCAREIDLFVAAVEKVIDAGVLEEAVDDETTSMFALTAGTRAAARRCRERSAGCERRPATPRTALR